MSITQQWNSSNSDLLGEMKARLRGPRSTGEDFRASKGKSPPSQPHSDLEVGMHSESDTATKEAESGSSSRKKHMDTSPVNSVKNQPSISEVKDGDEKGCTQTDSQDSVERPTGGVSIFGGKSDRLMGEMRARMRKTQPITLDELREASLRPKQQSPLSHVIKTNQPHAIKSIERMGESGSGSETVDTFITNLTERRAKKPPTRLPTFRNRPSASTTMKRDASSEDKLLEFFGRHDFAESSDSCNKANATETDSTDLR
ncbi:unnamed protein product [Dicrocoelium dendriticum]|nr:unnamed protein product [Dicrocoelium dendriticum]